MSSDNKRKATDDTTSASSCEDPKRPKSNNIEDMLTLSDIQSRIVGLLDRVPMVEEEELALDDVHAWAAQLQAVVEEFNLLLSLISPATYRWGTERTGAADQNLSLLCGELATSQEQISSVVTPRLSNVLAPVVDLVIEKTVITYSEEQQGDVTTTTTPARLKTKQNYYTQKQVDPEFLTLCKTILCRNAKLIRLVCLSNFNKISKCIGDFLSSQEKDSQHDRGFAY